MKTFIILIFLIGSMPAQADVIEAPSVEVLKTIYQAAKQFKVDAQDLIKIAFVESSFKVDARRVNTNGTVDFGMFQINSVHWSKECNAFNIFSLQGNAQCAAKLLSIAKKHADTDVHWTGRYHSKTPSLKVAYAQKLTTIIVKNRK